MMGVRLQLREFEPAMPEEADLQVSQEELEQAKLEAYDAGYQTGLEDAARAQAEEAAERTAAIARNLEDLSFTYHDARDHVLRAVEPLLNEMTATFLPQLAREALPAIISEVLMPLAAQAGDMPIQVFVHPDDRASLASHLCDPGFPLSLRTDSAVTPCTAEIRCGETEYVIDLAGALEEIKAAVRGFYILQPEVRHHG